MDPIVIKFKPPEHRWFPKLPHIGPRATKIIAGIATIIISLSMVIFVVFALLVNNQSFEKDHGIVSGNPLTTGTTLKSPNALPGGALTTGSGGTTGTNAPKITFTASSASVGVGQTAKLTWTTGNNPQSCKASGDWNGVKQTSGSETTPPLTEVKTYIFILTCQTATGTAFQKVPVAVTSHVTTGDAATAPQISIAANPSEIYSGDSTTIIWDVANDPDSCTASGDWSGAKDSSGSEETAHFTSAKQYTFTLSCANSTGTDTATTTLLVSTPPADIPVTALSATPSAPIQPGQTVTLSWTTTNSPTSCTASGDWSGTKSLAGSQVIGPLTTQKTYTYVLTCANSAGTSNDTAAVVVVPNPPDVSLIVSPSSAFVGGASTISWYVSNSPTSCTASGDWSGTKVATGRTSTGTFSTARQYSYGLVCSNAGGKGTATPATVDVTTPSAPAITLTASPISIKSGSSSNLTWKVANNPTSCTASGDWTGSKSTAGGTQSTGTLSTVKTYTYTMTCSNAGGTNTASTSVSVESTGPTSAPVVTIAVSPSSIGAGSSATISWSATNSPTSCTPGGTGGAPWTTSTPASSGSMSTGTRSTSGSFTFTLSCKNGVGTSNTASATLVVSAVPQATLSLSPATIAAGSTSTVSWSATNTPTSCTASGSWSGSKSGSGSQSVTQSSAGTYTYTIACSNSAGVGPQVSKTLTVTKAAAVYCGGLTPCYGPSDLALHGSPGNCWGWNLTWVIDITTYRPHHKGGASAGSLESSSATCDADIHAILAGSAAIPGYKDNRGGTKHAHSGSTTNNGSTSALTAYRVGYYDANKP